MAKRGDEYTPRKRACIVALHEQGLSLRQIAARGYGKKSAIGNVLRRYATGGHTTPKKRPGRRRISSERSDRVLVRLATQGRLKGSFELLADWHASTGVNASARTVRRRLFNTGLKSCRPAKKPLLTAFQRKRRLQFAKEHRNCTVADWKAVLFSDESVFSISANATHVRR
jgi:transposase